MHCPLGAAEDPLKMVRLFMGMCMRKLLYRALELPRDTNETIVENLRLVVKNHLFVLKGGSAPLNGRRKEGRAVWWKERILKAVKRRDRSWLLHRTRGSTQEWARSAQLRK